MNRVSGFAPIAAGNPTRLILGSMPGVASLLAGQYYAHPRNQFWRILSELLGMDPGLPYAGRVKTLAVANIALWDVLESCTRAGSLDADIEKGSIMANDFATFFARHSAVRRVYFNGSTAERCCRRWVLPQPLPTGGSLMYERLPRPALRMRRCPTRRNLRLGESSLAERLNRTEETVILNAGGGGRQMTNR